MAQQYEKQSMTSYLRVATVVMFAASIIGLGAILGSGGPANLTGLQLDMYYLLIKVFAVLLAVSIILLQILKKQ